MPTFVEVSEEVGQQCLKFKCMVSSKYFITAATLMYLDTADVHSGPGKV